MLIWFEKYLKRCSVWKSLITVWNSYFVAPITFSVYFVAKDLVWYCSALARNAQCLSYMHSTLIGERIVCYCLIEGPHR